MLVNSASYESYTAIYQYQSVQGAYTTKTNDAKTGDAAANAGEFAQDRFEKSETYVKLTAEQLETVKGMQADLKNSIDKLISMATQSFRKQGKLGFDAMGMLQKTVGRMAAIDEEVQTWAKGAIAEGGEWSIDKTAERILNFAKAISGGDTGKLETLKAAVQKGFDQAESIWGGKGKLPEISYKTLDKVMQRLDEWAGVKTEEIEAGGESA